MSKGILVVVFPPHLTHRLQPLDMSVFRSLAHVYSQNLDDLVILMRGISSITKRIFWRLFLPAWNRAVTKKNILSGYAKTGLAPLNLTVVLDSLAIQPKALNTTSIESEDDGKLPPITMRQLRRLKPMLFSSSVQTEDIHSLLLSCEQLLTQNSLLTHDNELLRQTVDLEHQKNKRGKSSGLIKGDESKFGQFFLSQRIQRCRDEEYANSVEEQRLKQQNQELKLQQ